jgi:hypothetical protein
MLAVQRMDRPNDRPAVGDFGNAQINPGKVRHLPIQ